MTVVWRIVTAVAALLTALGLFWFAQGIGLVTVDPILCTGDCRPVQAPAPQWQFAGGATALVGAGLGVLAVHRLRARRRPGTPPDTPAS